MNRIKYRIKCFIFGHILDKDNFCWRCGKTSEHECDGGDDYGLIDCFKCQRLMHKNLNRNK